MAPGLGLRANISLGLEIIDMGQDFLRVLRKAAEQAKDEDPEVVIRKIRAAGKAAIAAANAYLDTMSEGPR